ncbi:serine/arginine repetitive matrix protein 2-like isoform X1 [Oscarella lobularis]|uniref:serine/arginine repetitive matrix protein 2-like isoform X1 n=1 Tax=Oscarella lobularis TaxID=121494 RepID=UPI00331381CF
MSTRRAERIVEYFSKDPTQWNGKRNGVKPEVPRLKDNAHLPNGERRKAIDDALTYLRHELIRTMGIFKQTNLFTVQIRIEDQELHGHLLRMRKAMNSIKKQARLSMPPGALPSYDFTATPESGDDDDDDDDVAPLPSQQTKGENRPRSRTAPSLKVETVKFKPSHGASKSFDELDETTTTKSHLSPLLDSIDRNLSASYDCLLSPPSSPRTIGFDTIKFSSSEYSLLNRVAQEVDEARRGNFGAAGSPTLSLRRALLSNKEKAIVTKTRTPPTNRSSRSRPTSSLTPSIKVQAPPPPSFPPRAPPIKRTLSETGTDPTSSVLRRGSAAPGMKTIRDDDDDDRDSSAFLESPLTMRRNKSASLPRGGTDAAAAEIVVKKMQEKLAQERRAHLSRSPSVQRKFPGATTTTTMERRGGGGVDGMSSSPPPLRLLIDSGISHSRSENVLSPITGESSAASRRRSSDLAHSPDARFALSPPPSYSSHQGTDL